jgi:MoxR-like ATPase
VDLSVRFDRTADLPPQRLIEIADADPLAQDNPPTELVDREPYLASAELEDSINLAIALGRPLLLQGDPGAGKTRLAYAVAYALGLPLEPAYIKSTSRGQDLLYRYDAIRRLYDAQLARNAGGGAGGRPGDDRLGDDAQRYIRLGSLGRAIARATHGRRSVLLIDEIDKADIDFPNDLLRELDQLSFEVPEVPEMRYEVAADRPDLRPIIFVTNNEEKALPSAFLRRCIFHHVQFPGSPVELDRILALHGVSQPGLRERAIDVLLPLRKLELVKKPGLSELLDWVGYLQAVAADPVSINQLPHAGALVKQYGDQQRVQEWLAGR